MNDKTRAVFNGYLRLSRAEKRELIEEIRKEIDNFQKGISEPPMISLGPIEGGCPCCGR
jgi:hypothetical protein